MEHTISLSKISLKQSSKPLNIFSNFISLQISQSWPIFAKTVIIKEHFLHMKKWKSNAKLCSKKFLTGSDSFYLWKLKYILQYSIPSDIQKKKNSYYLLGLLLMCT